MLVLFVVLLTLDGEKVTGEERLLQLKGENASLRDQVQRAGDSLTMEREARRLGMVKPGERAYVIDFDE